MKDFDIKELIYSTLGSEPVCGVYELFLDDELIYVGQSKQVQSRIMNHLRNKEIRFDSFNITECDKSELNDIEAEYIIERNPVRNKTIPKNSVYCYKTSMISDITEFFTEVINENCDVIENKDVLDRIRGQIVKRVDEETLKIWFDDFKYRYGRD